MALGQEEVGRRIAQAREEAGLTQAELATRIGLRHPQSISNYERGETEVPAKRLRAIAEATGKDISYFLGEASAEVARAEAWDEILLLLRSLDERMARAEEAAGLARGDPFELPENEADGAPGRHGKARYGSD
jgi:transcriptional regulator with XRE-family HTH domain